MDDVKAARAQAEVARLHVDDHLVAHLGGADERHIGDRWRDCPATRHEVLLGPVVSSITRLAARRRFPGNRRRGRWRGAASASVGCTLSSPGSATGASRRSAARRLRPVRRPTQLRRSRPRRTRARAGWPARARARSSRPPPSVRCRSSTSLKTTSTRSRAGRRSASARQTGCGRAPVDDRIAGAHDAARLERRAARSLAAASRSGSSRARWASSPRAAARSARRRRTRETAAPGARGRDLNSGWNWEATKNG